MNDKVKANIENILGSIDESKSLQDSTTIAYYNAIKQTYKNNNNEAFWSNTEKFTENANLLLDFIDNGAVNGLFKDDYHFKKLQKLKNILDTDSVKKLDAVMWANADIIFSDALAALLKNLKQGRLITDSSSFENDTIKY